MKASHLNLSGVTSFYLFFKMKCGICEKHKIKRWCFQISLFWSSLINTLPMTNDKSSKTNKDLYPWINQDISGEAKLSDLNCLPVQHNDQKHGLENQVWIFCLAVFFCLQKNFTLRQVALSYAPFPLSVICAY